MINPASSNSCNVYFISNYSAGLCRYADLLGGVALGVVSIICSSPKPRFGGNCLGNSGGKTSAYSFNNYLIFDFISSFSASRS